MQRTIRIKLQPTPEQANTLLETHRQFMEVFNAVAHYGWHERIKNGVTLYHALYYLVAVDPRHTSQTCSRCDYHARTNRRARGVFRCHQCGYELHADLNAAYNIAAKYQVSVGRSDADGLPSRVPACGCANRVGPSGPDASRLL